MFGLVLISIITLMHVYVFWRASTAGFQHRFLQKKFLFGAGIFLWTLFFAGRVYGHSHAGELARILEFVGMNWMGILFLIFISVMTVDCVTFFGLLFPRRAPTLRRLGFAAGVLLSAIALFQGLRPPVIQEYEVQIPNLPDELNGTTILALSDLHIGSLLDKHWLAKRIDQVQAEHPDLIFLLGDIFEGHSLSPSELMPVLQGLAAPLGVWSVNGNHENHGTDMMPPMEEAGFRVLRNRWMEVRPGLILAGIDDLTALRRSGKDSDIVTRTLAGRPQAATILLTHSPLQYTQAAQAGVALMLSGHTHGGQIWPFGFLTKHFYPLLGGRYQVGKMTVIVSRGAGTWGPRMRLWNPSEILKITLVR